MTRRFDRSLIGPGRARRSRRERMQRNDRHLRRAVEANGEVHRADAPADEDACRSAATNTSDYREFMRCRCAQDRQHDLPSMRMTGEHCWDGELSGLH